MEKLRVYAGVDNIFNARPPYDLTGTENGSPYDPTGASSTPVQKSASNNQ